MSEILSGSIDLSKIDKSKIVEGKNGAKYYNIQVVINDTEDNYKNIASIQTNQTKEEREAKAAKVYLGNLKSVWKGESKKEAPKNQQTPQPINDGSDLPF